MREEERGGGRERLKEEEDEVEDEGGGGWKEEKNGDRMRLRWGEMENRKCEDEDLPVRRGNDQKLDGFNEERER